MAPLKDLPTGLDQCIVQKNGFCKYLPKTSRCLVPFPAQGHVIPLMSLAKRLHVKGFYITFVNTEFYHRRLIRPRGPDSVKVLEEFKFETVHDGLPPSDKDATQDPRLTSDSTRKHCLAPFKALLVKLNSFSAGPPDSLAVLSRMVSPALASKRLQVWVFLGFNFGLLLLALSLHICITERAHQKRNCPFQE